MNRRHAFRAGGYQPSVGAISIEPDPDNFPNAMHPLHALRPMHAPPRPIPSRISHFKPLISGGFESGMGFAKTWMSQEMNQA